MNPLLLTDSYKITHSVQYPPGTEKVYSYFESRGGAFGETVFFGLQYQLLKYLKQRIDRSDVNEAEELFSSHLGPGRFNREGWLHIVRDHLGCLPLSVKAVPEGTVVRPQLNVLMTVENTCPRCFWLTNYMETLLVQNWYPTTVATLSRAVKKLILKYLDRTGDTKLIGFKLHDFGYRGVSSVESAGIGGAAHLVNFLGTDTLAALGLVKKYYNDPCAGFSIPASEHSTITSWGKEHECDAFKNMLDKYPTGLVACVSDSFDIYNACSNYWGTVLRDQVLARDGCLVVRPDSGYPPHVVVKVLELLGKAFGYTTNEKGFKVLDPHVRVIQGDGCNLDMIEEVLHQMQVHFWSADNIAFGMGGGLLQQVNRDTMKFAFKCSHITVNGAGRNVFKQPVTDPGKISKSGRLALLTDGVQHITTSNDLKLQSEQDQLREVFRDGEVLIQDDFATIRKRAEI